MKTITHIQCPNCNGKGTYPVVAKMFSKNGWEDQEPVNMPCKVCNETGKVTQEHLDELKRSAEERKKLWCSCKEDYGVNYFENGQHPDLHKHHYRCMKCKKIVQIG